MKTRPNSNSTKIRNYLTRHPNANPKDVASRFNCSVALVYQLRKSLRDTPIKFLPQKVTSVEAPLPVVVEVSGTDIVSTLTDRGQRYGLFSGQAQITQELKRVMARHATSLNKTFTDTQWEALEMIAHKIGRIVNGDADHTDSWIDIAGYAKLVADQLQGIER